MRSFTNRLIAAGPVILLALGYDPSHGQARQWSGRIDTLRGGAVHVRNPSNGLWTPAVAWRLEEDLRIGSVDGAGPAVFTQINALAVDAKGRIYVLDRQAQEIRVFNGAGKHIRTLGRAGGGPGEFRQAYGVDVDRTGRLWVADSRAPYYTLFDTGGTVLPTVRREVTCYGYYWNGRFVNSGGLFDVSCEAGRQFFVRPDSVRAPGDSVPIPQAPMEVNVFNFQDARGIGTIAGVPFAPRAWWVLDPRGLIWSGAGDRYALYQTSLRGDTVRIIEREASRVPVSAVEREAAISGITRIAQGRSFDERRIPSHKPYLSNVYVEADGHVWVRVEMPEGEVGRQFDVFDPTGRYLGAVRPPSALAPQPLIFRGNAVYGIVRDELDVQFVVRVRIVRPSSR